MYIRGISADTAPFLGQMNKSQREVEVHQARLSSGDAFAGRVDNPADLYRASKAEATMRGSRAAERNLQDALGFLETKHQSIQQMQDMGQRLNELSVQYQNATLSMEEKGIMQEEAISLAKGIEGILAKTQFNDITVFQDSPLQIQSGANAGDKYTLSGTRLSALSATSAPGQELISRTYKVEANHSGLASLVTGELVMDQTGEDNNRLVVKEGGRHYEGTISFTGEKDGVFTLNIPGQPISGNLKLNTEAAQEELDGVHSYTLAEGGGGTVRFTLQSEQRKEPIADISEEIDLRNLSAVSAETLLSSEFIQEQVLSPLAKMGSSTSIEASVVERRLTSVNTTETLASSNLSRLQDTDTAREVMGMTQQKMLQEINANLFSSQLSERRHHILSLLS